MDIVDQLVAIQSGYSWQPFKYEIAELRDDIKINPLKTLDEMASDLLPYTMFWTYEKHILWMERMRNLRNEYGPFYLAMYQGLLV